MSKHYDYVIVGGGSAGCALANRLSADPSTSVLVLEAGRSDFSLDPLVHMPAALPFPIGNRFYDWKYSSEPEPHMGGRRVYHARGKVLGGSSSINGMIFQRGNPMDYERWGADPGMDTWDYAHCLPYFKKMENTVSCAPAAESALMKSVVSKQDLTERFFCRSRPCMEALDTSQAKRLPRLWCKLERPKDLFQYATGLRELLRSIAHLCVSLNLDVSLHEPPHYS